MATDTPRNVTYLSFDDTGPAIHRPADILTLSPSLPPSLADVSFARAESAKC